MSFRVAATTLLLAATALAAVAASPIGACGLPADLQREIAIKYPGKKVVSLLDLQQDDRDFFQRDHPGACPGLVKVDFYGNGKPTLALVLAKKSAGNQPTQLVVAHRVEEKWRTVPLGRGDPVHMRRWSGASLAANTGTFMDKRKFAPPDP